MTPGEAGDPFLTGAIAEESERFEWATNDFYESRSMTLELDGQRRPTLVLPWRCTAVTTVKTRDSSGGLTTQDSSTWRFKSSLDSAGAVRLRGLDVIELVPGKLLAGLNSWDFSYCWPSSAQAVEVAGTFGWTVTPARIKRAVALLVWNRVKSRGGVLSQSTRMDTADASYTLAPIPPEAQAIIDDFKRMGPGF